MSTTLRASAAPLTPTISTWASLSRVDIALSNPGPSPHAGGAGEAGAGTGPANGTELADDGVLTGPEDDAAGREAVPEQPTSSRGSADRAATPRIENRRLGIRTCCHGPRRGPTKVGRVLGLPAGIHP
ncbi:hypothetical protein MAIC_53040 [Mycolicibacterium aichiense]|uniref:Uncharacterized protein n=1 Tax=Mycolicibacterium aichiense TaxID=1799 RepID=A0AAD1MF15_9MYCO|nr:hypothetical protein MAIC_53040 [Mycolicibacterium aichiense]